MMTKEQRKRRRELCTKLSTALGQGHKISPAESARLWEDWKAGKYDPTTGCYVDRERP